VNKTLYKSNRARYTADMEPNTNTQEAPLPPPDPTKPILQSVVGYKEGITIVTGLKLGLLTLGPDFVLSLYEQEAGTGKVGARVFQVPITSVLHFNDYYSGLTFQPGSSAPQMYFEIKQTLASSRYDIMSANGKQLWFAAIGDLEAKPDTSPPIRSKKSKAVTWSIALFFIVLAIVYAYIATKNRYN
jgi:hypothetical protein